MNYQDQYLCSLAIESNEYSLVHIQHKYQTYEMCCKAIKRDTILYKFIREDLQTIELQILALNEDIEVIEEIKNPTYEMCLMAIMKDGLLLKFVPDGLKTKRLIELALDNNGLALQYVNDQTIEMIDIALKQNDLSYRFIKHPVLLSKTCKIIKMKVDECVICGEFKNFYFQYKCGHIACLNCKTEKCYYRCGGKENIIKINNSCIDISIDNSILIMSIECYELD